MGYDQISVAVPQRSTHHYLRRRSRESTGHGPSCDCAAQSFDRVCGGVCEQRRSFEVTREREVYRKVGLSRHVVCRVFRTSTGGLSFVVDLNHYANTTSHLSAPEPRLCGPGSSFSFNLHPHLRTQPRQPLG